MDKERYWLKKDDGPWKEVTREEYICAERDAGFRPKSGDGPATAGFSSYSLGRHIQGRVTHGKVTVERYFWDPGFLKAAKDQE